VEDLALELALDRTIARLEAAIAAHTRAWAGRGVAPPLPAALVDPEARRVLERAAGEARARPYLAACRLAAIECDGRVARVRAGAPSWDDLIALTEARAAAAAPRDLHALVRDALGVIGAIDAPGAVPAAPAAFRASVGLPAIDAAAVTRVAAALGIDVRALRVEIRDEARCFVVEPGRDVRVVVRGGDAPVRWSEALHELGHALIGLRSGPRPTRTEDEALAARIARRLEQPAFVRENFGLGDDAAVRVAAIARAGRSRQVAQRRHLADFEARLLAGARPAPPVPGRSLAHPPASLWLDPGAQLAYAAADRIADEIAAGFA